MFRYWGERITHRLGTGSPSDLNHGGRAVPPSPGRLDEPPDESPPPHALHVPARGLLPSEELEPPPRGVSPPVPLHHLGRPHRPQPVFVSDTSAPKYLQGTDTSMVWFGLSSVLGVGLFHFGSALPEAPLGRSSARTHAVACFIDLVVSTTDISVQEPHSWLIGIAPRGLMGLATFWHFRQTLVRPPRGGAPCGGKPRER